MEVTLVGFTKKGVRKDIRVGGEAAVIGRTPEADIRIPVSDVSRRHCRLALGNGKLIVKDLGSSNGTFVNDVKVAETALRPGDRLRVGPFTFVIQIDGVPKDIKSAGPVPVSAAAKPAASASPAPKGAPAAEAGKTKTSPSSDDFDIDDLDVEDMDIDELSPIEGLDEELEEIGSDELEELDESDIIDEEPKPKGKK